MSPLMAGAAVVTVIMTMGLVAYFGGFAGSSVSGTPGKTEIANLNSIPQAPSKVVSNSQPADSQKDDTLAEVRAESPETAEDSPSFVTAGTTGKHSRRVNKPSGIPRQSKGSDYRVKEIPMATRVPKLSNFDEPEDKSLRLTALFDQLDLL